MSMSSLTDRFEIINGPEDGTEFPIARAPFDVGMDPACMVNVRLDRDVKLQHAQVTVVADGYRIRALNKSKVWVNGKRTGTFRSRVVRNGDTLRVGSTLLRLVTASDGLASRSKGLATESDMAWGLKFFLSRLALFFRVAFRSLGGFTGGWIRKIIFLVVLIAIISYFFPGFYQTLKYWFEYLRWFIWNTLHRIGQ